MTTNVLIQTQIDDAIQTEAATVLAAMGLTISDAIRLMLIKVAHDQKLPFELSAPSESDFTFDLEAMKYAVNQPRITVPKSALESDESFEKWLNE
jgi:DNA-damage-inducible protein J